MLRLFQQDLESRIYQAWRAGSHNVMMVAATGSGKTVVLSKIMTDEPSASIAIAHRQELVSQISVALARNGVRHRLVGAKKGSTLIRIINSIHIMELGSPFIDPNARAGVGGVDTIIRMENDPWFNQVRLKIQDEAHHVLKENKWGRADAMFPNARGLYPTATPLRADGKGLGRHADGLIDSMVLAPGMRDIIRMGYLTDYKVFAPQSDLDLTQVAISQTTGDFNADQLRKAVHKSHIVGDVVQHYLKIAKGKLGVTFAVDVEAATEIAAEYRANGVPAEVVSAKTPDQVRAEILRKLKRRELLQLVNVDLFGEGFDLPAIEVVSFARPTESFALFCQQFGRALRLMLSPESAAVHNNLTDEGRLAAIALSSKPYAIIIDHVNNVIRHGLPDSPRQWSLDRRDRRSSKVSDGEPIRVCPNPICVQVYERFRKCCPHCGFAPIPQARSSPEMVDGDLTELDPMVLAVMRGEIERIDGDFYPPPGLSDIAQMGARKHWFNRQQAQGSLRNSIAWWAGLDHERGYSEAESYKRFFFKFGIDVASAQTLKTKDAEELKNRIDTELQKFNVDVSVNPEIYYSQR